MTALSWAAVGWLGNGCFFSRFLIQWLASERSGRSEAPRAFWWLSLTGAGCLALYTFARGEPVLLYGHFINSAIYARNLWIGGAPRKSSWLRPDAVALVALAAGFVLFAAGALRVRDDLGASPFWLYCSIVGQGIWSTRFVVQWYWTELRHHSHFPPCFWWVSLAGNALLLAYSVHLADAVLIAGYVLGPIVQVRNLILTRRATAK